MGSRPEGLNAAHLAKPTWLTHLPLLSYPGTFGPPAELCRYFTGCTKSSRNLPGVWYDIHELESCIDRNILENPRKRCVPSQPLNCERKPHRYSCIWRCNKSNHNASQDRSVSAGFKQQIMNTLKSIKVPLLLVLALCILSSSAFKWGVAPQAETTTLNKRHIRGWRLLPTPTGNYYEVTYTKTPSRTPQTIRCTCLRLRNSSLDYQASFVNYPDKRISGTANIAVKVETNYKYSGSTAPTAGWVTALNSANTSAATATTATTEMLLIPNQYGCNYRFGVDGTGTQSTSYVLRLVMKKKTWARRKPCSCRF